MNNQKFFQLSTEYAKLNDNIKTIVKRQALIKLEIKELLGEASEYSYEGAKAMVVTTERETVNSKKVIEKFGRTKLRGLIKKSVSESVRISYKPEDDE